MMTNDNPEILEFTASDPDVESAGENELEGDPIVPQEFHIHDAKTAAWVVRKIVEARAYGKRVRDWASREVRRAGRDEQFFHFHFGRELEMWARQEIENLHGRRRSVALPCGVVGLRKTATSLCIDNEEAVLLWAKESCPSLVVVTERLSKSALNEHFAKTGEVPPKGVHIEASKDRFYVR